MMFLRPVANAVILILAVTICHSKQPNIVFLAADDLGWNDVSWHNPGISTPNLEHLARTGIILNQSYVQPVCSPSRSAWLTGYYPYHTGMQHHVILASDAYGLSTNFTLLPQLLKNVGYNTHIVGKWHLGFCNWKYTPTLRGFDTFFGYYSGEENHFTHEDCDGEWNGINLRDNLLPAIKYKGIFGTNIFAERATKIIKNHDKRNPFFLYVPFQNAHAPVQAPIEYVDRYKNIKNIPRRIFSGMVTILDEAVGNITSALIESGLYNETIILFSTDNGGQPHCGGNNWPLRGSKETLWEGGTRGIAFVHSPLLKKTGFVYDGMIHAADWFPSILSIAGIRPSNVVDGIDFWENVISNKPSSRTSFIYNIDELIKNGAIREGKYKLFIGSPGKENDWYPLPRVEKDEISDPYLCFKSCTLHHGHCNNFQSIADWPLDVVKLFDVIADPTERDDLAKSRPEIVTEMLAKFKYYLKTLKPGRLNKRDPRANPANYGGIWSPGWC